MTEIQHRDLAAGRWWTLSLAEQLGNIGSEISRALKWRGKDAGRSERAFFRALELLDLTLDDSRHRASLARLREIARAREVVADFFAGENRYGSTSMPTRWRRGAIADAFAACAVSQLQTNDL